MRKEIKGKWVQIRFYEDELPKIYNLAKAVYSKPATVLRTLLCKILSFDYNPFQHEQIEKILNKGDTNEKNRRRPKGKKPVSNGT